MRIAILLVDLALEDFLLIANPVWLMPTSTLIRTIRVNSFAATKSARTAPEVLEPNVPRAQLLWFSEELPAAILLA